MINGVILVGVGRNLNRAIRTCYSFGVYDIYCLNCTEKVKGNLFSAKGRVRLHEIYSLIDLPANKILGLETTKNLPALQECSVRDVEYLAIGGELMTLKRSDFPRMAHINTKNGLCLTTEAALAIGLYELSNRNGGVFHNRK